MVKVKKLDRIFNPRGKSLFGFVTIERDFKKEGAVLKNIDSFPMDWENMSVDTLPLYRSAKLSASEWSVLHEHVTGQGLDLSEPFPDDVKKCKCYWTMTVPIFIPQRLGELYDRLNNVIVPRSQNEIDKYMDLSKLLAYTWIGKKPNKQFNIELLFKSVLSEVVRIQNLIPRVVPNDKSELEMWGII